MSEGETNKQKPKKEHQIILDAFRPHLSFRLYGNKLEIIDANNPKHFRIVNVPEELLPSVQKFVAGSIPDEKFDRLIPTILSAAGEVWEEGYDISARKLILAATLIGYPIRYDQQIVRSTSLQGSSEVNIAVASGLKTISKEFKTI